MVESNETNTEEEQERIDAVNRRQRGERPSKICKSLGRSRSWLQKWVERYNSSNKRSEEKWFKEKSRAPKNVHRRIDSEIEQLIITVRKALLELNFGNQKNSRSYPITPKIPKYRRLNLTKNRYQQTPRNMPNFALIPRCRGKVPASHYAAAPRFPTF